MMGSGETWRRTATVAAGTLLTAGIAILAATWAFHRTPESPSPSSPIVEAGVVTLADEETAVSAASPSAPARAEDGDVISKPERIRPQALPPQPARTKRALPQSPPAAPVAVDRPPPPAQPGDPDAAPEGSLPQTVNAARAIFQPAPVFPPELRRHTLAMEALVRFTVAIDGSADAELLEATPDPQINRILLDCLRRWRFFPATRDGRPVVSSLLLKLPIRVE